MNVLILLPAELDSNSGYQADIYASRMATLGHQTFVVHAGTPAPPGSLSYRAATHLDFFENTAEHLRAFEPDVVYAWTPREIVRLLWEKLVSESQAGFRLVIHFEDNEQLLAENCQPEMIATGSNLRFFDPERGAGFIDRADGFTFVVETLAEIVPIEGRPVFTIGVPYDDRIFRPEARNVNWRRGQGINDDCLVIVYSGNVHRLNFEDVSLLYRAVGRLAETRSVSLIRTGGGIPIDSSDNRVTDLGFVPRQEMPGVLAAADLFVQPGCPGPFDNYRFPSKIPEMAITGRPLICPDLPCLSAFKHGEEIFKCKMEDPDAIGDAVTEVISTTGLHEKLSRGAVSAAMRECDPAKTAPELAEFFISIVEQ